MPKRRGIGKMTHHIQQQFRHSIGLPFADFFTEENIGRVLSELEIDFRQRVYSPAVTLLTFIAQVLVDRCCRSAVSRVIATSIADGRTPPSQNTGAYCQARIGLPSRFFERMLSDSSKAIETEQPEASLWLGKHRVHSVDGSSAQASDTAANRKRWGLPSGVTPGCGFPVVPFVGFFCVMTGVMTRLVIGKKGTHERRLFRMGWDVFKPGDVCLGDRGFCAYADFAMLQKQGVWGVFRLFNRTPDFRQGERLGKDDHIVEWTKPKTKPRGLTKRGFARLPERLLIREIRIRVDIKGFRSQELVIATTLLDPNVYTKQAISDLYLRRWEAELNFRHIKTWLGMELLSTQKPETVRKEIMTYMIAYNMIRVLMWRAGQGAGVDPLRLSFAGAVQHLGHMSPHLGRAPTAAEHGRLVMALYELIAGEKLPYRPNRAEPRVRKRRPKSYPLMTKPRKELKKQLQGR